MFGDVNLSEQPIREGHRPGADGWPMIRYFNKETGSAGKTYKQKTDMSMCEELGLDHDYLQDFIEHVGKTSMCALDGTNCDEASLKYLEQQKEKDAAEWIKHLNRLNNMEKGEMKRGLKFDLKKRKRILTGLLKEHQSKDL